MTEPTRQPEVTLNYTPPVGEATTNSTVPCLLCETMSTDPLPQGWRDEDFYQIAKTIKHTTAETITELQVECPAERVVLDALATALAAKEGDDGTA